MMYEEDRVLLSLGDKYFWRTFLSLDSILTSVLVESCGARIKLDVRWIVTEGRVTSYGAW
jgi:hypothetical protein